MHIHVYQSTNQWCLIHLPTYSTDLLTMHYASVGVPHEHLRAARWLGGLQPATVRRQRQQEHCRHGGPLLDYDGDGGCDDDVRGGATDRHRERGEVLYVLQRYVSYAIGYYTTCMHSTKEAVVRLTE